MKKLAIALLSLLGMSFSLCPSPTMTCCYFESIQRGESIDQVVSCAGKPFRVRECDSGSLIYLYRVRDEEISDSSISYSGDDNLFREAENYYLEVRDGRVVNKWIKGEEENPMSLFELQMR